MSRALLAALLLSGCSPSAAPVADAAVKDVLDAEEDAFFDGTDSGLCPAEQPTPDGPCTSRGLHCQSSCRAPSPGESFWTADCRRCFSTLCWQVVGHPCAPEFGDGGF